MGYDEAAWGALALALTVLGGVVTFFRWRSRGLAALLRGSGLSLLPLAAWLTGLLELVADIGGDISRWAVHLVFSPVVWLGIVLAGVAGVLFGAGTWLAGRGGSAPAEVKSRTREPLPRGSEDIEGMDDINAILRKHGIS